MSGGFWLRLRRQVSETKIDGYARNLYPVVVNASTEKLRPYLSVGHEVAGHARLKPEGVCEEVGYDDGLRHDAPAPHASAHDLGSQEVRMHYHGGLVAVDYTRNLVREQPYRAVAQSPLHGGALAGFVEAAAYPLNQVWHCAHQVEVGLPVKPPEGNRRVLKKVSVHTLGTQLRERRVQRLGCRYVATAYGGRKDKHTRAAGHTLSIARA